MDTLEEFEARGRRVPTPQGDVFAIDFPADAAHASRAPVLALHGFPTSCWDFRAAVRALGGRRRVVAFDFFGYGLSAKPKDFGYSLFEQADVATLVARALGVTRAHVWSHDMGTSVLTELLARRERGLSPLEIASAVFMNGSVHIELAHLTAGQKLLKTRLGDLFARLNTRTTFKAQMRRVLAKKVPEAELDAMWTLLSRDGGTRRLPQLIRYTEERARFRSRWIGALERLDIPALVAWGRRDPVAVMAIAEALAREIPNARFETWNDLGHYPHVEDAPRVAATIEQFWNAVDALPRNDERRAEQ